MEYGQLKADTQPADPTFCELLGELHSSRHRRELILERADTIRGLEQHCLQTIIDDTLRNYAHEVEVDDCDPDDDDHVA